MGQSMVGEYTGLVQSSSFSLVVKCETESIADERNGAELMLFRTGPKT